MVLAALTFMTPPLLAEADSEAKGGVESSVSDAKKSLVIFENYLRLKNGVVPSTDSQPKREALQSYRLAFANARDANIAIASRAEPNCKRFVRLYNDVGSQISFYYEEYLGADKDTPVNTLKMIEARLRILDFYEQALFSLVFMNAEAGSSVLDPGAKKTCATTERKVWTTLLLSTHQKLQSLHDTTLGEPGALVDESEAWKQISSEYSWKNTGQHLAWIGAETAASIYIWDKAIGKTLDNLAIVSRSIGKGRLIKFLVTSAYISGWVAFDREMRNRLPFLMRAPDFRGQDPMSGWDDLMKMGEEFLVSNLASPPLYFAYIDLLSMMRKRTIFEFLRYHEWSLQQAEQEYGSIENAIERLKEAIHDQDKVPEPYRINSNFDRISSQLRRVS